MSEVFSYKVKILEKDLDTFSHVNNANYLALYEEARWEFCTDRGYGVKEIQDSQIGPVILELNLKFKKELTVRETITIQSQYVGAKNARMSLFHQEMIKEDGSVASTLDLTLGLMDLKKRKLIKPDKKWLRCLGISDDGISSDGISSDEISDHETSRETS